MTCKAKQKIKEQIELVTRPSIWEAGVIILSVSQTTASQCVTTLTKYYKYLSIYEYMRALPPPMNFKHRYNLLGTQKHIRTEQQQQSQEADRVHGQWNLSGILLTYPMSKMLLFPVCTLFYHVLHKGLYYLLSRDICN